MRRSLPLPRHLAGACLLLAALPLSLAAQSPPPAEQPAVLRPTTQEQLRRVPLRPVTALAPLEWRISRAETNGMRDAGRAAPQPVVAPIHGLRGFKLQFQNGDHKLRRLGVVAEDRFVTFSLADNNGDDPFLAHAEFINLSAGQMGEVAGIGGGKFEIPLPAGPANHVPVLSASSSVAPTAPMPTSATSACGWTPSAAWYGYR